jgi:hypothetical protein
MGQAEDAALSASRQLQGWLYNDRRNRELMDRIRALAEIVVYHHDILDRLSPGQRGRFGTAMAAWAATVADCRRRASTAVDHANQLVDWYWLKVLRHHRELQHEPRPFSLEGWRPAKITIDPVWEKPDALLPRWIDGEELAMASIDRVLLRAIEILTLHLPPAKRAGGGS